GAVRLNDKEYEVLPFPMYDGDHDYEIVSRESRTWIDAGQRQEERAFVQTSTSLHIPKTENTITHANMPTAGLIELEGDIYFTVPATANSSGINAIYKLNFVN